MSPTVANPPSDEDASTSHVSAPCRAAATAAATPALPPPTTSTSGRPMIGTSRAGSWHVPMAPGPSANAALFRSAGGPDVAADDERRREDDGRADGEVLVGTGGRQLGR